MAARLSFFIFAWQTRHALLSAAFFEARRRGRLDHGHRAGAVPPRQARAAAASRAPPCREVAALPAGASLDLSPAC